MLPRPRRVVFLAHSFADEDHHVVEAIKKTLRSAGCLVVTGEAPATRGISEKIRERIDSADAIVALFTRRHAYGHGQWTTIPWVVEEKAYSFGSNARRPIILVVEDGIPVPGETGGLHGDLEHIPFDRHRTLDVVNRKLRAMLDELRSITPSPEP